jgi:hypothetical protein
MRIREAILALVAVWVPDGELVFGGHPAISPLVEHASRSLGAIEHVHIFQSEFFRDKVPPEAQLFPNLHWTPVVRAAALLDESASLSLMRKQMILFRPNYHAAVFIGGMDGLFEEQQIFATAHSSAHLFPIASTGAAAEDLWKQNVGPKQQPIRDALRSSIDYRKLFRDLLVQ